MTFALVLDLVVAALLVVTIAYAVLLNRRLANLRRQRAELESGTAAFQRAIRSAEDGIARLKLSTEGLQQRIDGATAIQNDLAFLVDRAESLADRLEGGVRAARSAPGGDAVASNVRPLKAGRAATTATAATTTAAKPVTPTAGREPRSEAERALLQALAGGH